MTVPCFPSSRALPPFKTRYSTLLLPSFAISPSSLLPPPPSSSSSSSPPPPPSLTPLAPSLSLSPLPSSSSSSPWPAQRSPEWFALRRDRLTTSSFSTALGFWRGNRRAELWQQKVFSPDADHLAADAAAMAAMQWGVDHEAAAVAQYQMITGRDVTLLGFAVHPDASLSWLGASPDGVLADGILEVKCPFNKGKPELGLPWTEVPYYYMPQVQGQMEIMGMDWVDLYCWTVNGSSIFRVERERGYWEMLNKVLKEFWWGNVVPARDEVERGREEEAMKLRPGPKHEMTAAVVARSRKIAAEARLVCREVAGHVEFFG